MKAFSYEGYGGSRTDLSQLAQHLGPGGRFPVREAKCDGFDGPSLRLL